MRSTADIPLKWNDICNADIIPNRSYMRSIADIPKLDEMPRRVKRSDARHHGGRIQEYFLFNVTQNIIVKGYILKRGGISR